MKLVAIRAPSWVWLLPALLPLLARSDVRIGTNGERFVGAVIEQTATNVVFDSEFAGQLVFPRAKIRELLRAPSGEETNMPLASAVVTNTLTKAISWKPPGSGMSIPTARNSNLVSGCVASFRARRVDI
jgi:hypothetical protein